MPDLQIVLPLTRQLHDFLYISISGTVKENPHPDILEDVRMQLDSVDGLEARWKVLSGRSGKTYQEYFEIKETLKPLQIPLFCLYRTLNED